MNHEGSDAAGPAAGEAEGGLPAPSPAGREAAGLARARQAGDGVERPDLPAAARRLDVGLTAGFAEVLGELRDRLASDRFKEEQITRLHEELQAYKNDLIEKPARQLLRGLIRLHADLGKIAVVLRGKPAEELTPERFLRHLADFEDDIELLLGQHGVERFAAPGERFDPHRQTALRTVATHDSGLVGEIAERLQPGFEQGELLLQKERVAVYIAARAPHDQAQGDKP